MKLHAAYPISVLALFLLFFQNSFAQFNVRLTLQSGSATTTCTDAFGSPDPAWGISVGGQAWTTYPASLFCPAPLPALYFDENYQCLQDVPATIQVCLRAFENDAFILDPCTPVLTCQVEQCFDVPIPYSGSTDILLELPDGLASDGEALVTIAVEGFLAGLHDEVCDALDLGVLENGDKIGDSGISTYNNYCATGLNEPNPLNFGVVWSNEQSVWFRFTTSDDPSTIIKLDARNDPSNLGDPIHLQMGVFATDDNTCTGNFSLVAQNFTYQTKDERIYFECPEPNKTYFVIMDAVSGSFQDIEGYFGFEVNEMGLKDAPDLVCDALAFGPVPEGGAVGLPGQMTNVCATSAGDRPNGAFFIDHGVWFSFQAPSSGHVLIEGISDTQDVPINLQLALYASSDNTCAGMLTPYQTGFTNTSFDETMEVSCLQPGQTYFLLVDGHGADDTGIFTLTVTDAGDDTPVTPLDEVVCFGETFTVGNSTYAQSGSYVDTLLLPNGCDSVVLLDLQVLTALELNMAIEVQGVGPGNTDGQASVSPTGGAGNYTYFWPNGQTSALATGLVGGEIYCVTITDEIGCSLDSCFEMPYYVHFVPEAQGSFLTCFGDTDGTFSFTARFGVPPYLFSWKNDLNTISGAGMIQQDGQMVTVENLPAGDYEIFLQDIIFDTTVLVSVGQPDKLEAVGTPTHASCFGFCDGMFDVQIVGGTPPYQIQWSNGGISQQINGLCQGSYAATVSDANACSTIFTGAINQPIEFVATAVETQTVSCFLGNDGAASVSTNGNPIAFQWSANDTGTSQVSGLPGGQYFVTVTNMDGCTDVATVVVNTPAEPVTVLISQQKPIVCNGGNDGELLASVSGPGSHFTFQWSNGTQSESANGLVAGAYSVTVESELGCTATASFALGQPDPITLSFSTNKLTCNDPPDGGIVTIEQIGGGVAPYTFSSNGAHFADNPAVTGFYAGDQTLYVQDAGGCVIEVPATIVGPVEMVVSLGDDLEISLGDEVNLSAQVNISNVTYEWIPAPSDPCLDCQNIQVVPTHSGIYQVIVTDDFDCTETAEVFISVLKPRNVFIPNAFSPNNDGINDLFVPNTGKDVRRILEFRVFDRQGNHVFFAGNFPPGDPSYGWDGHFKGQAMQPGVFVWYASLEFIDGEIQLFKGDVTLVR